MSERNIGEEGGACGGAHEDHCLPPSIQPAFVTLCAVRRRIGEVEAVSVDGAPDRGCRERDAMRGAQVFAELLLSEERIAHTMPADQIHRSLVRYRLRYVLRGL